MSMPDVDSQESRSRRQTPLPGGLEHARQQLLDLGLRNNLLNYRLLKTRGLESHTESPDELFQALVSRRQVRFAAVPREDQGADRPRARRTGDSVTTLPFIGDEADLERRLLNTHDHARISLEEQGLNSLFLAFGMLEWYESDDSSNTRLAPLVLVPVELSRRDARSQFVLNWTEEDIGGNLSLKEKLDREFGIELPEFDPENGSLTDYFESVEQAIEGMKGWRIHPKRVVLGHFSFNKFLMYHDLDPEKWPVEQHPLEHPILEGLLSKDGFTQQPSNYSEDVFLDDVVSDDDHTMVVDADGSQTLALLDAIDGRTMVVQGPPGTGKSQTITNLIALAIGQGKRVLFVAEKMAALEVVKRRLDTLGLGEACLELHGTKTRKRRVLDDLNYTLGLGEPQLPMAYGHDLSTRLGANRAWLNNYCRALSEPVGNSNITAYDALGVVVHTRDERDVSSWPSIELRGVAEWDPETLRQRTKLVTDLQMTRRQVGDPAEHPFRGVRRTTLSPIEMEDLRSLLRDTFAALARVSEKSSEFWSRLHQQPKLSPAGIETAVATGKRASTVDAQGEIRYADPRWIDQAHEITSLIEEGETARNTANEYRDQVTPETWDTDLAALIDSIRGYQGSIFRWFSPTWWSLKGQVRSHVTAEAPDDLWTQVELLDGVRRYQDAKKTIEEQREFGSQMFGRHWQGIDSDWERLRALASSGQALHRDIREHGLSSSLLDALDQGTDRQELAALADELGKEADHAQKLVDQTSNELMFEPREFDHRATRLQDQSIVEQSELIRHWLEHFGALNQWVGFRAALHDCHEAGMGSVADLGWKWDQAGELLEDVFHYRVQLELVDHAWRTRSVLTNNGSENKDRWRAEFGQLDQEQLRWNRALLARRHWEQLPRNGGGEVRTLLTEIQKKRRNLPIRQLMKRAGNAIQAVKPVFMMSPLSVANFIPPGALQFDLVVFDEASQVEPVDAFGAILRGKQAIVVGDDRQLPPTDFFQRTIEDDDVDEDQVSPADVQSILNLFLAQNSPQRMLRWHYRSQHESLIAVSNREFYDNRLVVFPSPSREYSELGLRFNHLPDTVYDRGRSKTNVEEAKAVAAAVMEHAFESPELTLGVAAFSKAQADAIRDQLLILRREDPDAEAFFNDHEAEPFFIKSLENVQGDERDVIFISVGYGRDEHGRVTNNFGPVNNEGGERRLNVLITRSRRRCEVFTNITDEDISASSPSQGVQALRTFLRFARTNEFPVAGWTGAEVQSPFEHAVKLALEREGWEIHTQVGSAGYFIDLAVVDQDRPGRYLLAIECDGASYHSARSSRDRDRLRQQVLESLGWRFHRIWSTDWFADPRNELSRAIRAIEEARQAQEDDAPPVRSVEESNSVVREQTQPIVGPDNDIELAPYEFADIAFQVGDGGFEAISDDDIADAILEIADVEGPIHHTVLFRRITQAAGLKRTGSRIRDRIAGVLKRLVANNRIVLRDEFVWPAGMTQPPLRSRTYLDTSERKLELIAPQELDAIILDIVQRSFSIGADETARLVIRSIGLQRSGHNAVAIVRDRIQDLLNNGALTEQGGALTLADN